MHHLYADASEAHEMASDSLQLESHVVVSPSHVGAEN